MASLYTRFCNLLNAAERAIFTHLGFRKPDAFAVAVANGGSLKLPFENKSALEFLNDPFLWAVPRHRRSIYRRRQRRFGSLEGYWKMLVPKKNLIICTECGGHKEMGRLCPACYNKVRAETELMQEKIEKELGLSPVDKEVVVLYEGEEVDIKDEYWEGKRIVEMKKPRPNWFSKNLMQQSTQAPATTTTVEPKDLA